MARVGSSPLGARLQHHRRALLVYVAARICSARFEPL